jgi:hypothetical protein
MIAKNHAGYMTMLLPTDSIGIYGETDLVTNWYKRNLRIMTNLNRVAQFPGDRVILLIGAGHVRILNDLASASPHWCVEEARTYLNADRAK